MRPSAESCLLKYNPANANTIKDKMKNSLGFDHFPLCFLRVGHPVGIALQTPASMPVRAPVANRNMAMQAVSHAHKRLCAGSVVMK